MSKTVVVFGALSPFGIGVVNHLLQSEQNEFTVRAVAMNMRTSEDPDCQTLLQMGASLCTANLEDPQAVESVVRDAWAVFLCLPVPLDDFNCMDRAVVFGKNVVTACCKVGVQHVIYSTASSPLKLLGISARHLDARAKVEQLFRQSGLRMTYLMMPLPFEALFGMLKPTKIEKGHYALEIPTGPTPIDYICASDIGPIVHRILLNPQSFLNKTVAVSSGKLTAKDITQSLNKICVPAVFHDNMITYDGYRAKETSGSVDWGNMFEFLVRIDQQNNREKTRQLNPHLISFEDWLKNNKHIFMEILEAS